MLRVRGWSYRLEWAFIVPACGLNWCRELVEWTIKDVPFLNICSRKVDSPVQAVTLEHVCRRGNDTVSDAGGELWNMRLDSTTLLTPLSWSIRGDSQFGCCLGTRYIEGLKEKLERFKCPSSLVFHLISPSRSVCSNHKG